MSLIEELAVRLRAASDELPVAAILAALERFGTAAEQLRRVRESSADPMGVPELGAAVEHAEAASHALRVAQEHLAAYLAAIGMADGDAGATGEHDGREPVRQRPHDGQRQPEDDPRRAPEQPQTRGGTPRPEQVGAARRVPQRSRPAGEPAAADVAARPLTASRKTTAPDPAGRWWRERVAELTGSPAQSGEQHEQTADPGDLLRRVARQARSGDRDRLHAELRRARTDAGLGLAALTPPLLRELCADLLGHPPRGQDLPRLRREVDTAVRSLLPGLPAPVLEDVLSRVCRTPPPRRSTTAGNPADPAVASAVLTGYLAGRLNRDLPERRRD